MSSPKEIILPEDLPASRLDKVLADQMEGLSRSRVQALIEQGHVRVNGRAAETQKQKVEAGDVVSVTVPDAAPSSLQAQNIPLDIMYEDADVLVINKPAGMVVHPGAGNADGTLVNALLHHCGDQLSGIGGVARPGIVHRLDKDTSGLMMVAKTDSAHQGLSDQLADRSLSRTYDTLIWGAPCPPYGVIDAPIGRHPHDRLRMSTRGVSSREARTHYKTLTCEANKQISHLECVLESGRTHQIRVHCAHLGFPVVGDPVYGAQTTKAASHVRKSALSEAGQDDVLAFSRQALHAKAIRFIHPITGEAHHYEQAPPADMLALITHIQDTHADKR